MYSKPFQPSKMERFAKLITILAKSAVLDIRQDSEKHSAKYEKKNMDVRRNKNCDCYF